MTAQYRVSKLARADIRGIGKYTQDTYGAEQRRLYLSGLGAKFDLLAERPLLYAERADFTPPVRIARYEEHLVIYLIDEIGVLIVRVLHKRMDVAARLSDD